MKKDFFERFSPTEKTQNKSISLPESDWKQLEAYRLYGSAAAGHEIPLQRMIREILMEHMNKDRSFANVKDQWIERLNNIEKLDRTTKIEFDVTGKSNEIS